MLDINYALRQQVFEHRLYDMIKTPEAVCLFMKYHVFCVWDFQSLAQKMQHLCSSPNLPWMPSSNRKARRLMNEIILEEESDVHPNGGFCSHFELYLDAMEMAGADRSLIDTFLVKLAEGESVSAALDSVELPEAVRDFTKTTFGFIEEGQSQEICAAFTRGRETIIPEMFTHLVESLAENEPEEWGLFHYYLQRHIDVDGGEHGPASEVLLESFCATAQAKAEAVLAAEKALRARLQLWDAIASEIDKI